MYIQYKNIFVLLLMFGFATATASAAEDVSFLLTASAKGDLATVSALLGSGANANAKDVDGITALMYAARKNNVAVVSTLLNNGADVSARDNSGWTALMFAAKKGYTVQEGKDINFTPDEGFATNPSKQWEPDYSKYDPAILNQLKKGLK